jgi:hypothetical protein
LLLFCFLLPFSVFFSNAWLLFFCSFLLLFIDLTRCLFASFFFATFLKNLRAQTSGLRMETICYRVRDW